MLFRPAVNTSAFLKMGVMGKQGAGKTKTAGKIAIGLVQYLQKLGVDYASKPVGMFDTETGSDFLIPDFEAAGIPFVVIKSKTLKDLIGAIDEAEANCSVLIIDSITHPYRELIASYLKQKNRTFLQIDDWNYIKGPYGWEQFTRRFINSKLHIVMCGRAGDDLEQYVDENGKRQLEKVGTKMKTEAETGFEPSLLVLMELKERSERGQGVLRERVFVNQATVVKDRWDKINGSIFDDPDFKDFLPHIGMLALGGEHVGVRDTGDSRDILKTEKRDWQPVQRKIVIGEIQDLMVLHIPGQTAAEKQRKVALLRQCFNAGWVEIEETMPLDDLRAGYDKLHRELEGKPSKYAITTVAPDKGGAIDSLPDHSAPPAKADPLDIPENLRRPSLEEKLLAQMAELTTSADLFHFGIEVMRRADLDTQARLRVSSAVKARIEEAERARTAAAEPEAPGKPKRERKPAKAAELAPLNAVPQTYINDGVLLG
jgi:hypothetical protein